MCSQIEPINVIEGQIRECFGRVVYSHKTHEKCADLLQAELARIKFWQLVLSALTTGGFVSTLLGSGKSGAIIGAVLSTTLLALNAYTKDYNLGEQAQKHRQAANDLWLVRERYLSLLTDIRSRSKTMEQIQAERDDLSNESHEIYSRVPSTNDKAYKKAQKALQYNEDMTFSDKEIDAFLPNELKKLDSQ